ncbi:MAG: hypothetical protein FIA97_10745 [Methylococcaceae bacterium]|nr:hypothetical protein [Methylococcaceae bacterium]
MLPPAVADSFAGLRFLLYHKHFTSARTRFVRFTEGTVLAPHPLPFLSSPLEPDEVEPTATLIHPATLAKRLAGGLHVSADMLEIDPEFLEHVEIPGVTVAVHLVRVTSIDPPLELFAERGAQFCPITDLRGGHPTEMALLRKAYEHVLGG